MNSLNTTYILCLLLFFSCSKAEKQFDKTISVNLKQIKTTQIDSSSINNVSYVFLETNRKCLIGGFDKMLISDSIIYVFDKFNTKTIFCFNKKGKFIYKIDKIGKGPGEYIDILDFSVDNKDNVYTYDNERQKLITYQNRAQSYFEKDMKYRFLEFALIDKSHYLVADIFGGGMLYQRISVLDIDKQRTVNLFKRRKIYDSPETVLFCNNYLYKSKDIIFPHRFSNIVYKYKENTLQPIFYFNKELIPDKEFIDKVNSNPVWDYKDDSYLLDIINIYENDNYYIMDIIKGMPNTLIINKKTAHAKRVLAFQNSNLIGITNLSVKAYDNNYFVSVLNTRDIGTELFNEKVNNTPLPDSIKHKFYNLKQDDNPVLIYFDLKDN